jgi:hypothetical protein
MVDKLQENAYIWYSRATDITGKKLAEALNCKHGDKKPPAGSTCLVIGWGAKTKDSVSLGDIPVLNHPDRIRDNRNKLGALQLMQKAGVNVAPFVTGVAGIGTGKDKITLPVVGRTKYHQGGKGFWSCPTMSQAQAAASEGADYFQEFIEIKDEYRLHTFGGKVIYAVKKTQRTVQEMEEAYIRQEMDRQKTLATKNNDPFDEPTALLFLRRQAKTFAQDGANMLVRSNKLGWKFVRVKAIDKALESEAVKALKAIGLNYGAVDACIDVNGKPYIIEVNTGPGLEESTFAAWTEALKEAIAEKLGPKKTLIQKAAEKISGKKPATATVKNAAVISKKEALKARLALMQEMTEAADAEEASVLDKVFGRMFGE